ncbi:MAG: amylo-alpha-1,6-glucosidase [Candidatus Nanoarchaeia archaeon]
MQIDNEKCYVITSGKSFIFRFANSYFGSKWCGIWKMPIKLIDYFAYKIRLDEKEWWLSAGNQTDFNFSKNLAIHSYESNQISIKEKVYPKGSCIVSEISLRNNTNIEKEVNVMLEFAANIRMYEEDYSLREYHYSIDGNSLFIENDIGMLLVSSPYEFKVILDGYKEHFPGNYINPLKWKFFYELPQRCFVIRILVNIKIGSNEEKGIPFFFFGSEKKSKEILMTEVDRARIIPIEQKIENITDNEFFNSTLDAIHSFRHESDIGNGYFAGYPYFTMFWGRDTFLILPSYVTLGRFEEVVDTILLFAKFQSNGENYPKGIIPNNIMVNGKVDYESSDATPLWLIALNHYFRFNADNALFSRIKDKIENALNLFEELDIDGDHLVEADKGSKLSPKYHDSTTWMDNFDRSLKPFELQVLWMNAFSSAYEFLNFFEIYDRKEILNKREMIKKRISEFWNNNDFYYDRILLNGNKSEQRTANPLFALYLKEIEDEKANKILNVLESDEFTTPYGIRAYSSKNVDFNPDSYHKGMVRGLLTNLMIFAEFNYDRKEKAMYYLNVIKKNFGRRCINSIDEVYDSSGKPQGAVSQAWSICFIPRIYDELIFGIKPNAMKNELLIEPKICEEIKSFSRQKFRVNNEFFSYNFERYGDKKILKVMNLSLENVKVSVPGKEIIKVNGEIYKKNAEIKNKRNLVIEWE